MTDRKTALFPGSFDPFTKGHADIAIRGSRLFDEVVIGIGVNSQKKRYLPVEYMIEKIQQVIAPYPNVRVAAFSGLTAGFAKEINARFLLRGLRNTTDFEYENSIAQANRHIFNDLETVFLITTPQFAHISSTITREIHKYGQNVDDFLPYSL